MTVLTLHLAALAALAQTPVTAPEVQLELLADRTHVVAGETLQLGLRFRISEEHWHIYWENPGDSGMATDARVTAPEGFRVGPLRFPGPASYFQPGDIVNYGYEDEVVIFVPVHVPADLGSRSEFEFAVEARWLVCKEVCFIGNAEARLTLPVADRATIAGEANAEILEPFRKRLPRPWSELAAPRLRWSGSSARPVLGLSVKDATRLEFFPHYQDALGVVMQSQPEADGVRITFETDLAALETDAAPLHAKGVLRVDRKLATGETSVRFYVLELPVAHGS